LGSNFVSASCKLRLEAVADLDHTHTKSNNNKREYNKFNYVASLHKTRTGPSLIPHQQLISMHRSTAVADD
jgi:hypothetical protein